MSSLNFRTPAEMTTNSVGTPVKVISPEKQLRRLTMAHMLWEKQFYVDGKDAAKQLLEVVGKCSPALVAEVAKEARTSYKLRHVPLLLARGLATRGALKAGDLAEIIQRPDEMSEFLALYWKDKKQPVSNQVKKGLALAFSKFNEYQLAKWDKNSAAVSIRDVMFLTHPKPVNSAQEALFKKVADKQLETPDTWETELSAGADKRVTFTRLMAEKKLGALAFLRNLRNMVQAGVSEEVIRNYSTQVSLDRVLPFRFISAAKIVPQFTDMLEAMMFKSLLTHDKLKGHTVLVVDTSGSMGGGISDKSDLNRLDAAAALAILAREICEDVTIFATAGDDGRRKHATVELPKNLRGFALAKHLNSYELRRQIGGGGIFLVQAMDYISNLVKRDVERVIVFTDEQDTGGRGFEPHKAVRLANGKNYIMNVGSYQNGINSGAWETITGFSEASLDYIQAFEKSIPTIS